MSFKLPSKLRFRFNNHDKLRGKHAFLSASKYHWLNYDSDKLRDSYLNSLAITRGTKLHAIAKDLIDYGIDLPRRNKTLNMYVNDAIGFQMETEKVLFFSDNCFGTADAMLYDPKRKLLRIHDLKTGVTPAHMEQLLIYAALFCLEYKFKPNDIKFELRIYQNDEIIICKPTSDDICSVMQSIIESDNIIKGIQKEEGIVDYEEDEFEHKY